MHDRHRRSDRHDLLALEDLADDFQKFDPVRQRYVGDAGHLQLDNVAKTVTLLHEQAFEAAPDPAHLGNRVAGMEDFAMRTDRRVTREYHPFADVAKSQGMRSAVWPFVWIEDNLFDDAALPGRWCRA